MTWTWFTSMVSVSVISRSLWAGRDGFFIGEERENMSIHTETISILDPIFAIGLLA